MFTYSAVYKTHAVLEVTAEFYISILFSQQETPSDCMCYCYTVCALQNKLHSQIYNEVTTVCMYRFVLNRGTQQAVRGSLSEVQSRISASAFLSADRHCVRMKQCEFFFFRSGKNFWVWHLKMELQ